MLLHGLTATRRYVVHGSRMLERGGHRVIKYDARGHGQSPAADVYDYPALADDLAASSTERRRPALLAGASMGAHTIVRFALDHPELVRAAVLITPAFDPDADRGSPWDDRARGLREGGIEGFLDAIRRRSVAREVAPGRSSAWSASASPSTPTSHAVADAIEQVPRSRPFEAWADLAAVDRARSPSSPPATRPTPSTRSRSASATRPPSRAPPSAPRTTGQSPLAWQGGQLSRIIAETAERAE